MKLTFISLIIALLFFINYCETINFVKNCGRSTTTLEYKGDSVLDKKDGDKKEEKDNVCDNTATCFVNCKDLLGEIEFNSKYVTKSIGQVL
jgi:hypothetical protein